MTHAFALRDSIDYKIAKLGPEEEPLILIDGIMRDPEAVLCHAESEAAYGPAGAAYPGLRATIPADYSHNLYAGLGPLLHNVFDVPRDKVLTVDSTFAMVVGDPRHLHHNQRVPHTDSARPHTIAMVHYLCDARFGGTAFFRHRATGWQRITEQREAEFSLTLSRELNSHILPAVFPGEDHPLFARVAAIDAAFDRLIIYRASILHSPAVAPRASFSADPRKGRLTITSFLDPKA